MRRTAVVRSLALACALAAGLVQPAAAEPPGGAKEARVLPTPQLLDVAVAAGRIDRDTANLYLAWALSPSYGQVPAAYRSSAPWDGTLPLLHLRRDLAAGTAGRYAGAIRATIDGGSGIANSSNTCSGTSGGANQVQSDHFVIDYGTVTGGLTIQDYEDSLDQAWDSQIGAFGWAAPPLDASAPGDKYHVVVANLGGGLYGYVDISGTFAGDPGNNPSTAWAETDAFTSCMALNRDYSGFPGSAQQALDATTAHEFNHSIQFGYGALTGANLPDDAFVEGGATWMEDEVFDGANDNYNYLWPTFTTDMGQYTPSPYPYWVVFRAITERYGAGVAGGGEDVMQRFWEEQSKNTSNNLGAMQVALAAEGTNLGDAYHGAAVALRFNRTCGGGYVAPYCLEEGPQYVAAAGAPGSQGTISSAGGSFNGSVRDNYSLNWVKLPSTGTYDVSLHNTSGGGQLRGSVACDTGSAISVAPLPTVAGGGQTSTLDDYSPAGCLTGTVYAVITNQNQTSSNPGSSTARTYTLSTAGGGGGGGGGDVAVTVKDFKFMPKAATAQQGDTVEWTFTGPSNHTVTDSTAMALFGIGSTGPGGTYPFTFVGAGNYAYTCTIHPSMVGTIKVPVTASPASGGTGTSFTVVWSSGGPPAGFDWDIQIKRPGKSWKMWKPDQTALSSAFVPDGGIGTYLFRAHLERNSNGATSKWSVAATITVG